MDLPIQAPSPDLAVQAYIIYLGLSLLITVWTGQTLYKNGYHFLVASAGSEALAKSLNHLLIVGFYLVNFGFVALNLRIGRRLYEVREVFEANAFNVGLVLLVLGAMHFFNLYILHRLGQRKPAPPPLPAYPKAA